MNISDYNVIYGYARKSTAKQNIERQVRNILRKYPTAEIITETFTGTKIDRPEWTNKIYKKVRNKPERTLIVFDEVSRMSRNAEEGYNLYMELFDLGVDLAFLKEPHINTESYREAMKGSINISFDTGDSDTNELFDGIINAINKFMRSKVKQDIKSAFEQAQNEVDYLHQRTKEGIETARLNGKQIGGVKGKKLTTKKSIEKKAEILKHSIDFGGTLKDSDCMKLTGLARNTFYKYKRELKEEAAIHN